MAALEDRLPGWGYLWAPLIRLQEPDDGSAEVVRPIHRANLEYARESGNDAGDQSWTAQEYPRDGVLRSFWSLVTTYWRVSGAQYE